MSTNYSFVRFFNDFFNRIPHFILSHFKFLNHPPEKLEEHLTQFFWQEPYQDTFIKFKDSLSKIRDELKDDQYLIEARQTYQMGCYRSAILNYWNATVSDLRIKVMTRNIELFNRKTSSKVKIIEDFQMISDEKLIQGALDLEIIDQEGDKMLRQIKEIRNLYSGHPGNSYPSLANVIFVFDTCNKYVLSKDPLPHLIDLDEFLVTLKENNFNQNKESINGLLYSQDIKFKNKLVHNIFTLYTSKDITEIHRTNIEFIIPLLWGSLDEKNKSDFIIRVNKTIHNPNKIITEWAFSFIIKANANDYLSDYALSYKIDPLVTSLKTKLKNNSYKFHEVDDIIIKLKPYAAVIPKKLYSDYISSLIHTYVGYIGTSNTFARIDFYADKAVTIIPEMIDKFNQEMATEFNHIHSSCKKLQNVITNKTKAERLQNLEKILKEKFG